MNHYRSIRVLLLPASLLGCLFLGGTQSRIPPPGPQVEECTIGVACAVATKDQRPLLWKTRDAGTKDNEVYYNTSYPNRFIAVVNANGGPQSEAWMGVNEHGFAILNAYSPDLGAEKWVRTNGEFMRDALGTCHSVEMFLSLLDTTVGNRETYSCFGVIDSTGAAFIFEASPDTHWSYDAREAPGGFIVRTNFSCNDTVGTGIGEKPSAERFLRSIDLISQLVAAGNLSGESLLSAHIRDFADRDGNPVPVPCWECGSPDSLYGLIDSEWSICRQKSVSTAVIHGVTPKAFPREPAFFTTMWVLLGNPAVSVAVPYWPVGPAPAVADGDPTAPLCDRARYLREWVFRRADRPHLVDSFRLLDGNGGGLWSQNWPAEQQILAGTAARLEEWRGRVPGWATMLAFEDSLAEFVLELLLQPAPVAEDHVSGAQPAFRLEPSYPNPANPFTEVSFELFSGQLIRLAVFDVRGRRITTLFSGWLAAGRHSSIWDGMDDRQQAVSSGLYFLRLEAGPFSATRPVSLIR